MDTNNLVKQYRNGEITVVWKPGNCIHSKICWQQATGLPEVFNPKIRPWIKMEGSTTEKIIAQVNKCPSGALSFYYNDSSAQPPISASPSVTVEIMKNGPLVVQGTIMIKEISGNEIKREQPTAFCRCGRSAHKPYCDGSHMAGPRFDD